MIKITIQEDQFFYSVDYSHLNTIDGGFLHEHYPSAKEAVEDVLKLLGNVIPPEQIADALAEGVDAMEDSKKGWAAKRMLEKQKDE